MISPSLKLNINMKIIWIKTCNKMFYYQWNCTSCTVRISTILKFSGSTMINEDLFFIKVKTQNFVTGFIKVKVFFT